MGKRWKQWQILFSWAPKSLRMVTAAINPGSEPGSPALQADSLSSEPQRRSIPLLTKVWIVKAIVFPVVMYGCESWTLKKAERQKIDAFELWCWRRLLRVPWKARSNQPISKEVNPEYSLEGWMLKLKLQYFGHLMRTADSLKKTLMLGKTEDRRRRGWQRVTEDEMASLIQWTWTWANSKRWEGQGSLVCCSP